MKRGRETESPQADDKAYRRQLPVSCQFCRNKKLKCDREQPCSNCVARNIDCTSAVSGKKAGVPSHQSVASRTASRTPGSTQLSSEELLSRLEKLEQAVFKDTPPKFGDISGTISPFGALSDTLHRPTGWQSVGGSTPIRSWDFMNQSQPRPSTAEVILVGEEMDDTSGLGLPVSAAPAVQDLSQLMLRTSKYEAFLLGNPDLNGSDPNASFSMSPQELALILPTEELAVSLFDHFAASIVWIYRIVHIPTTRTDLQTLYMDIRNNKPTNARKLALLATILAVAAHLRSPGTRLCLSPEDARYLIQKWTKLAESAMVETKHDIAPSIETLQASIYLTQLLPTADTGTKNSFLASTFNSARQMGLHQLDSKRNVEKRRHSKFNLIDLEIRRRVWWHITTTDWMLSYSSGPQEGTYLVHPDQMNVLLPSNADDIDITPEYIKVVDVHEAPTEMTYTMVRYWFSTILRIFVDTACSAGLEVDELEYEQVLRLDECCNQCMKGFPYFFLLDDLSRERSNDIDRQRPYIAWQRQMAHFAFHTRISRLHRPFMTRGYKDPKYAYSRMMCLRSSRVVIELEKAMQETGNGMRQQTTSRLWTVIHHVFMATVTLVMDYCCNRDDPRAAERKEEILDCYKVLERSQAESPIARKGLAHLKNVMNEWRAENDWQADRQVNMEEPLTTSSGQPPINPYSGGTNIVPDSIGGMPPVYTGGLEFMGGMDPSGIDLAQDLWMNNAGFDVNFDPQWDSLFNVLENQPGIYGMNV